ncbi:MAG: hypothetical protein ACFB20_04770 [Opitutales bacterium]
MAADLALLDLLDAVELNGNPRAFVRHYTWAAPAFTFGLSQRWEEVRQAAQALGTGVECVRRPTGGGLVDHRADWTYALAAAPSHPFGNAPAQLAYQQLHLALAEALAACGRPATLQPCAPEKRFSGPNLACFTQPEIYDVICPQSGRKLAGAAQKRTRQGLLVQGSLDRKACALSDWKPFYEVFCEQVARLLGTPYDFGEAPEAWRMASERHRATFACASWNQRR